jgi:DnaJ-class molecular chaperone
MMTFDLNRMVKLQQLISGEITEATCPECDGEGEVEYERTTGGVSNDTPWIDIVATTEPCDLCGGWGKVEGE